MKRFLPILFLLIATPLCAADHPKSVSGKVVAIADGDTLTVLDADKAQHKIRLHGIDCPEKKQAFGTKAREALSELVFGKEIEVEVTDKDRYGRLVGKVKAGTTDVNAKMVRDGYAWRYSQYDKAKEYADAEAEAREKKRGLWADNDPVPPWEFRKKK